MPFLDENGLGELWRLSCNKFTKIETGSYTGTGASGPSNPPCSITFDFVPKMVIITARTGGGVFQLWYEGLADGAYALFPYNTSYYNHFTLNGNTLSWYNDYDKSNEQFNEKFVYTYIALG